MQIFNKIFRKILLFTKVVDLEQTCSAISFGIKFDEIFQTTNIRHIENIIPIQSTYELDRDICAKFCLDPLKHLTFIVLTRNFSYIIPDLMFVIRSYRTYQFEMKTSSHPLNIENRDTNLKCDKTLRTRILKKSLN